MNIIYISSTHSGMHSHSIYYDLLQEFVRRGDFVTVVYAREKRLGLKTDLYKQNGIQYLGVKTGNLTKNPNLIDKGWATLRFDSQFVNAIEENLSGQTFDLVLFSTPPITFIKTMAYFAKTDAFIYLMLKDIFPQNAVDLGMFSRRGLLNRYFKHKERYIYSTADFIGVMSPRNRDYLIQHNPSVETKVEVLPNALKISENALTKTRSDFNLEKEDTLLLYGGNLGLPQGVDFILECMDEVENMENVKLVICGTGSESDKIARKISDDSLKHTLYFGQLEIEDYNQLTQLTDIGLIFLDHRFTIPNYPQRILSYMEAKKPVICATDLSSDVGTIAENNDYGFFVESNDSKKWASTVQDLVKNKDIQMKMGLNGYRYLLDHYNVENAVKIIYNHILK